ncbi:hypothetical protein STEG23_007452 [Scotinomys teguina]
MIPNGFRDFLLRFTLIGAVVRLCQAAWDALDQNLEDYEPGDWRAGKRERTDALVWLCTSEPTSELLSGRLAAIRAPSQTASVVFSLAPIVLGTESSGSATLDVATFHTNHEPDGMNGRKVVWHTVRVCTRCVVQLAVFIGFYSFSSSSYTSFYVRSASHIHRFIFVQLVVYIVLY